MADDGSMENKLERAALILGLSDEELAKRLDDPAGLDRLLADLEEVEAQEPERWDGMG